VLMCVLSLSDDTSIKLRNILRAQTYSSTGHISECGISKFVFICHIAIAYRVAQNKIPHQTICNISATSGLISKILEAA